MADERTLEQFGEITGGMLSLGNCQYRRVMVDDGCRLDGETQSLIRSLAGGAQAASRAGPTMAAKSHVLETSVPVQVGWRLEKHPLNSLLLECVPGAGGDFTATFSCAVPLPEPGLEIQFADGLTLLELNGVSLAGETSENGAQATIAETQIQATNTIRFRTARRVARPFVWLQGFFRVISATPFSHGPRETVKTDGPFIVHPQDESLEPDMIAGGFPFLRAPLFIGAGVMLPGPARVLHLDGLEADAVRLAVDGCDGGWGWRMNGVFRFNVELPPGSHQLRLELVPNGFNTFGPHHYYGGDGPVVSPDQMRGVCNFADPPGAPARTHVKAWHFRRFHLPERVRFFA